MGQKVNPTGLRVGIIEDWRSKWFENKNYAKWLHEDLALRAYAKKKLYATGISKVEIERAANKVKVSVHTAKPGIIIGKKGAGVEDLRNQLQKLTESNVLLNIVEVRKAELDAQLRGRERRAADGAPCVVPSRDEEGCLHHDALRREADPHQLRRPPRRRGDVPS